MGKIGVIGGSGLYEMKGLQVKEKLNVETPFGKPSDEYVVGELAGKEVIFLPRHGRGHRLLPHEVNYRANIYGMKKLGAERIISIAACGSLKEEIAPLDVVIVDQFFDRTNSGRKMTFFGEGVACHIAFAQPVCPTLCRILTQAAQQAKATVHSKGTYVNMEGPAFSTLAESKFYQQCGFDVIGMTNMSEARLAREAEICYATVAMVTDYDCWHVREQVSVEVILNNLRKNVQLSQAMILWTVQNLPEKRDCLCATALKDTVITSPKLIPEQTKKNLEIIIGKYLK
jgi:5'-methylthioadenosine phosphorylase